MRKRSQFRFNTRFNASVTSAGDTAAAVHLVGFGTARPPSPTSTSASTRGNRRGSHPGGRSSLSFVWPHELFNLSTCLRDGSAWCLYVPPQHASARFVQSSVRPEPADF